MLIKKELDEIEKYYTESENPLVFFDDDPDGLSSFLLLFKKYKKGYGVPVKSAPDVEDIYTRKINERSPDRVFILDRPRISQELIDKVNAKIIWLDHHEPLKREGVKYYNPRIKNDKDNRPVSYWCYKITKENLWVGLVGMIGDYFFPENLIKNFEFKELFENAKNPGDALFKSKFGILVKIFSFILKGKTSEVRKCISILARIESPLEILEQTTSRGKYIYKRFEKVNKEYERLLKEALKKTKDKIFLFTYPSTKMSFIGALSNELMYKLKNDVIIIGREKDGMYRLSLRSNKIKIEPILKKVLEKVEGSGGGHLYACGANIKEENFDEFIKTFKKYVENGDS